MKSSTICKIIIAIIILIIIAILTNSLCTSLNKMTFNVSFDSTYLDSIDLFGQKIDQKENTNNNKIIDINSKEKNNCSNWQIKIPVINLVAQIEEGTTKEIMNKYVGHFEETKTEFGNIGLAGHNRGYPVNYFENLKNLKQGDEIIYNHEDFEMIYEIQTILIIENTNWDYLKDTEDNRITLITCVENEPKYRRCIQGVEKIIREDF